MYPPQTLMATYDPSSTATLAEAYHSVNGHQDVVASSSDVMHATMIADLNRRVLVSREKVAVAELRVTHAKARAAARRDQTVMTEGSNSMVPQQCPQPTMSIDTYALVEQHITGLLWVSSALEAAKESRIALATFGQAVLSRCETIDDNHQIYDASAINVPLVGDPDAMHDHPAEDRVCISMHDEVMSQ